MHRISHNETLRVWKCDYFNSCIIFCSSAMPGVPSREPCELKNITKNFSYEKYIWPHTKNRILRGSKRNCTKQCIYSVLDILNHANLTVDVFLQGCRNFYDSGMCKEECPPMMRYNPSTYSLEMNPDGKYAYGATCVKKCPDHLLRDSGACVRTCPANKKAENNECVPCDGPCPKSEWIFFFGYL